MLDEIIFETLIIVIILLMIIFRQKIFEMISGSFREPSFREGVD